MGDRTPRNKMAGKRQRHVLRALGDQGAWWPRCGWGHGTDGQTLAVLRTLQHRGEVTEEDGRWFLTPRGYAWLITDTARDLGLCPAVSKAYDIMAGRIARLGRQAQLAAHGPVNWRGEQV